MIGLKYGTYTDKQYKSLFKKTWTSKEVSAQLILAGWVKIEPFLMLEECGRSMKRQDSDPNFLTFRSFNDMGSRTKKKFTDSTFEAGMGTDKLKKLENMLTDVFEATQEHIMDGVHHPDKLYELLKPEFCNLEKKYFMSEIW